jgi:nicotinamidase-related amidase
MDIAPESHALVVCDMQPDLLGSIPAELREPLLDNVRLCIDAARQAGWLVVFQGLRFGPGYAGVGPRHRIYGGLQRLNAKVGDAKVHWFMEGYAGSGIEPRLLGGGEEQDSSSSGLLEAVVWRRQLLPGAELTAALAGHGTTKVAVVGLKAGYAVQATCQVLCNEGLHVSCVRECCGDDLPERLSAVFEHLLPVYADVVTLADVIDDMVGMERYVDAQRATCAPAAPAAATAAQPSLSRAPSSSSGSGEGGDSSSGSFITDGGGGEQQQQMFYLTDCGRGGHMARYCRYLLQRPNWRSFPTQVCFPTHSFTNAPSTAPLN